RAQRRQAPGRLLRETGLTDHLDAWLGLQELPDAAPDHLVVVEEIDTHVLRRALVRLAHASHGSPATRRWHRNARPGTAGTLVPGAFPERHAPFFRRRRDAR